MEIKLHQHEIERCIGSKNSIGSKDLWANDIEKIMSFYNIPGDVDEVHYDIEAGELIFYVNPCRYW